MPTTLVWMKSPGPVIERSTWDSAARCITCVMAWRCTTSSTAALSRRSTCSKTYFGCRATPGKVFQAPGVSQAVEVDQLAHLGPVDDVMNQIGADETGAAGDQQFHALS